jgi:hypothetical protein
LIVRRLVSVVYVKEVAGHASPPMSETWKVDATKPALTIGGTDARQSAYCSLNKTFNKRSERKFPAPPPQENAGGLPILYTNPFFADWSGVKDCINVREKPPPRWHDLSPPEDHSGDTKRERPIARALRLHARPLKTDRKIVS